MPGEAALASARPSELPRRAVVTAAAVALLLAAERIPLPGVDPETFRSWSAEGWRAFSLAALGPMPLVAAYVLVELVALVVPRLRPLRHGGAARRRPLVRAAWSVAVALSAWHGWTLATMLQGEIRTPWGHPSLEPGVAAALGVAAAVVLGTVAFGALAALVTRHGIGDGFAVSIAALEAQVLLGAARRAFEIPRPLWSDASLLFALALAVVVPLVASRVRRTAREREAVPRASVPTCGLVPLTGTDAAFGFPARLAEWFAPAAPLAAALGRESWLLAALAVVLAVGLAAIFAVAFAPPREVEALHRRALGAVEPADAAAVRSAARTANRRSVALVAGLALLPIVAALLGSPFVPGAWFVLALGVVAAVALDAWEEVQARAAGLVAPAYLLHRVIAVRPALDALAAAGVAAFARGRRFRTLHQLFAPYTPIAILVAPGHVALAEAVCARVEGDGHG